MSGSIFWSAPEVLVRNPNVPITTQAEVYSFAIVLWEILTQQLPFSKYRDASVFINDIVRKNVRLKFPESTPHALRNLVSDCWNPDPNHRPTWLQIVARLQRARIDIFIPEHDFTTANILWKTNWIEHDRVPVDLFISELIKDATNPNELIDEINKYKKCLNAIFNKKKITSDCVITLKKFQKLLSWFGGLRVPVQTILSHLAMVLYQNWFFGSLDGRGAEVLLQNAPAGTFLVRFNHGRGQVSTPEAPYTVSRVELHREGKRVSHSYVQRAEMGGLFVQMGSQQIHSSSFSILPLIVKLLMKGMDVSCRDVCPGHPFLHLFSIGSLPNYMPIEKEED